MSLLDAILKTTVEVSGVYLSIDKCIDSIRRYIRPFSFRNEDHNYELSLKGTCFLAKYMGKFFLIATKHQLGHGIDERHPEDICITVSDDPVNGRIMVSSSEVTTFTFDDPDNNLTVEEDIVILGFNPKTYTSDITDRFFSMPSDMADLSIIDNYNQLKLLFTVAYPSKFAGYPDQDFSDPENVKVNSISAGYCRLFFELESKNGLYLHSQIMRLISDGPIRLKDFDGVSGAPVFFIYQDASGQCHLGFAGIVQRGGTNGHFHIYDALYLKKVLLQIESSASAGR